MVKHFRKKKKFLKFVLAFEFFDQSSAQTVHENLKLKTPISEHPFYVLVETSGSNVEHDTEVGVYILFK